MKTCRKDFQGRKSTAVLKLLCRNIAAGRFNWRRYCTPYSNMPEVEYDWEMGKLTIDEENWKEYFRHSEQ